MVTLRHRRCKNDDAMPVWFQLGWPASEDGRLRDFYAQLLFWLHLG